MHTLDPLVCERARLARDPRFDGLFFTAVKTTGIYCRPLCPAPPPKPANVDYYRSAAEAEAAGFRPCLRCRPELSPAQGGWRRGDTLVARALRLIEAGALDDAPLADIARRLHLGERHLRRLFVDTLGVSPQQVQATRRLLFAKQLLSESRLPMTDVAAASGFRSLRRFNAAFSSAYGIPPTRLRGQRGTAPDHGPLTLRLGYRPPFDFAASLDFLRLRGLPGIEDIGTHHYARMLQAGPQPGAAPAWLHLSPGDDGEPALRLRLHNVPADLLPDIVQRVRRMFDLDADPATLHAHLGTDPLLTPLLATRPGLRLAGGWDGFEVAVRAVLGQQVSVAAATTLARRLVERHGQRLPVGATEQLHSLFPPPAALRDADLDGIGLTRQRAATIHAIAAALDDGLLDFAPEQALDDFIAAWTALPGIGGWSAHYIAMRGLRHPDAFPAGDLILRRRAGGSRTLTERQMRERAEDWRPWRSHAVVQLWHAAADTHTERSS
ncbi:MAG: AlkA N-terminal domain-containing protein [Pseudoxanthomonas suwonensis]|nr:AlkA N-terminal domain-containing protein [Pseudoxanthomonas suwonensis]